MVTQVSVRRAGARMAGRIDCRTGMEERWRWTRDGKDVRETGVDMDTSKVGSCVGRVP